jgi:hypothetical protein
LASVRKRDVESRIIGSGATLGLERDLDVLRPHVMAATDHVAIDVSSMTPAT